MKMKYRIFHAAILREFASSRPTLKEYLRAYLKKKQECTFSRRRKIPDRSLEIQEDMMSKKNGKYSVNLNEY